MCRLACVKDHFDQDYGADDDEKEDEEEDDEEDVNFEPNDAATQSSSRSEPATTSKPTKKTKQPTKVNGGGRLGAPKTKHLKNPVQACELMLSNLQFRLFTWVQRNNANSSRTPHCGQRIKDHELRSTT